MSQFIVGPSGTPEPPNDILARLRRVHPALGLRFGDGIGGVGWKLTWEWPASDRRWSRVVSQEIPPDAAHDVIGYLPMGCTVDEAPAYVENHLKNYPREEVHRLRAEMYRWNHVEVVAEQTAALVADAVEDTMRDKRQKNPRRTRIKVTPT